MSFITLAILAAVAALTTAGLILALQVHFSRCRRRRFDELDLIPNILMTRYPLLFIGRSRSLFRFSGDFLELPVYLQEHGYQVEEIEMSSHRKSADTLTRLLSTSAQPVHLLVSEAFAAAAYDLALDGHTKLATLTVIGPRPKDNRTFKLRPPRLPVYEKPELRPALRATTFATEEIALEHMVSLAEYDLR